MSESPPPPTPAAATPAEKLARNIHDITRRTTRGKAAAGDWSIRVNGVLRVGSILLTSLGSAGVIADKVSGNLPGEIGWAFWGSVVLLVFGILTQLATEFRIGERAASARALADRCALCEVQLENILVVEKPQAAVAGLLGDINKAIEGERFVPVLPPMTPELEAAARELAQALIDRHSPYWDLGRRPRSV
jgi:hypothetical protein